MTASKRVGGAASLQDAAHRCAEHVKRMLKNILEQSEFWEPHWVEDCEEWQQRMMVLVQRLPEDTLLELKQESRIRGLDNVVFPQAWGFDHSDVRKKWRLLDPMERRRLEADGLPVGRLDIL